VAANIDRVVVVVAVAKPGIRTGLIDRYLLAVEQGGAQPVLCVNKVDLATAAEQGGLDLLEPYYQLGLPVVLCSAARGQGIEELRRILDGHLSVFVGHSGVGKSSLLNTLKPELDLTTAAVRRADGTGRHTTTRSHLYKLAGETWIIDTPGIREFGLWNLEAGEIGSYFPELVEWAPACKFANCTHSHEPQCAVKQAVDGGQIPVARYEAYLRILASLKD
jgi:ribosome biogenesis GTPase